MPKLISTSYKIRIEINKLTEACILDSMEKFLQNTTLKQLKLLQLHCVIRYLYKILVTSKCSLRSVKNVF